VGVPKNIPLRLIFFDQTMLHKQEKTGRSDSCKNGLWPGAVYLVSPLVPDPIFTEFPTSQSDLRKLLNCRCLQQHWSSSPAVAKTWPDYRQNRITRFYLEDVKKVFNHESHETQTFLELDGVLI
jgi:hypothetical protein